MMPRQIAFELFEWLRQVDTKEVLLAKLVKRPPHPIQNLTCSSTSPFHRQVEILGICCKSQRTEGAPRPHDDTPFQPAALKMAAERSSESRIAIDRVQYRSSS